MEKINQYDGVIIKPGTYRALSVDKITFKKDTNGCAVEVYGDQDVFDVDIGSSPEDWDTITVKREDIIGIRYRAGE